MAFQIGQKVVCINDENEPGYCWLDKTPPVKGVIYTIVRLGFLPSGRDGVWLYEMPGDHNRYLLRRFRPLVERKTDIGILKRMLTPKQKELV